MAVRLFAEVLSKVPSPDVGYIAGEAPVGIVTLDNVPGIAVVDLLQREGHVWIRRTISRSDGTYGFYGIQLDVLYDVIGQDVSDVFGDVIVSRVYAYAPPTITTPTLEFALGMPATTQMEVNRGAGPFVWSAEGLPPGITMDVDGLFGGSASAAGSYVVSIGVVDAHGSPDSRAYNVVIV